MPKNRTDRFSHKKTGDALDAQAREYETKIATLRAELTHVRTGRTKFFVKVKARVKEITKEAERKVRELDAQVSHRDVEIDNLRSDLEALRATKSAEINERVRIAEQKARDLEQLAGADRKTEDEKTARRLQALADQVADVREQLHRVSGSRSAYARASGYWQARQAECALELERLANLFDLDCATTELSRDEALRARAVARNAHGTATGRTSYRTSNLANAPRVKPGCPVCKGTGATCTFCGAPAHECLHMEPMERCPMCGGEG